MVSGVKSFFKRKDKPKENIKTINQINEVPELNASRRSWKKHRRYGGTNGEMPKPVGNSVFKFSKRCTRSYIN
jgi:hypothetical protein